MKRTHGMFLGRIRAEFIDSPGSDEMRLTRTVHFIDSDGEMWTAHKGEIFDGESKPWFCWWLLGHPYQGRSRDAAVFHDVYYRRRTDRHTRRQVDRMYYQAMRARGVCWPRAWLRWAGVRIGGWRAWQRFCTNCGRQKLPLAWLWRRCAVCRAG